MEEDTSLDSDIFHHSPQPRLNDTHHGPSIDVDYLCQSEGIYPPTLLNSIQHELVRIHRSFIDNVLADAPLSLEVETTSHSNRADEEPTGQGDDVLFI